MPTFNTPEARDRVIRTIIGEAAANDPDSMISVAHVIKNRADSGQYGEKNASGTVMAPKQFSMWNADIQSHGKTISPSDPRYQRAGQIADAVFGGQIPDNTGGADHYFAPSGMAGGHAPSWAIGKTPTATIGGQHFYKFGLSNSDAVNQGHTSAGPIGEAAPPLAELGEAAPAAHKSITDALAGAKAMLGKNEVPDHDEIMKYLHDGGQDLDPHKLAWCASFVSATLQRAGLPVPTQVAEGSKFGGGANARNYLTYGKGVDDPGGIQAGDILVARNGSHVGFAEGPMRQGINGPEVQLLAGNEGDHSGKYQPGSYTNPDTGAVANRQQVGMVGERWVPLSDYVVRRADADGGTTPVAVDPNAPAPAAQPTSATAPAGTPTAGGFPLPGATPAGPRGSGVVLQGMMSSGGKTPITAGDWSGLFGGKAAMPERPFANPPGGAAAAPPATTAAPSWAATARPDLGQRVPLASTPLPPERPVGADAEPAIAQAIPEPPPARRPAIISQSPPRPAPLPWPTPAPTPAAVGKAPGAAPPAQPIAPPSLLSGLFGQGTPVDQNEVPANPFAMLPGSGVNGMPAATAGTPSMGFPAQTNPFGQQPQQQTFNLPGSMMASAQSLIKSLFG